MPELSLDHTGCATGALATCWYRVVDTESTGPEPAEDVPIEVAFQDVSGTGQKGRNFVSLLNPGRPIPPLASAVHHLIDDDVRFAPQLEEVWADLIASSDGIKRVFVAHQADFDRAMIRAPKEDVWICTYRLAMHLWPELLGHGNEQVRYQLGLEPDFPRGTSHRAVADVATTVAILLAALPLVAAKWPDVATPEQLAARVQMPCRLAYVPFHPKGRRFDDEAAVDDGLLQWIIRKGAGGIDCVHTAEAELSDRAEKRRAAFMAPAKAEDDDGPF